MPGIEPDKRYVVMPRNGYAIMRGYWILMGFLLGLLTALIKEML